MAINYPIIETQLRLIRALQKGYVEALEAGDWQAADYRCAHLNKLCEGLFHLSQLLERENTLPPGAKPKNSNNWVNSVRATVPSRVINHANESTEKPTNSAALPPEPTRYEWGASVPATQPPPIDEVW